MKLEPKAVRKQVELGCRARDRYLETLREQLDSYLSRRFKGARARSAASSYSDPEPIYYEVLSLMLPSVAFDRPRAATTSRLGLDGAEEAEFTRHMLNRWAVDTEVEYPLEEGVVDGFFRMGVLLNTFEPTPGFYPGEANPQGNRADSPAWPRWYRISPYRYCVDPFALSLREARFKAHLMVRDRNDLLREAQQGIAPWDEAVVKGLSKGQTEGALERYSADLALSRIDRDEIAFWVMWFPEVELKDSPGAPTHHGTIAWLPLQAGKEEKWLRPPEPFFGHRFGPYSELGIYTAPDEVFPLAPFTAGESLVRSTNSYARALERKLRRQKNVAFVSKGDPGLADAVKRANDGDVVGVDTDNLDKKIVQADIGGGGVDSLAQALLLQRGRLDRIFGVTEVQRGNVQGIGTATEQAIAGRAAAARMEYVRAKVRRWVARAMKQGPLFYGFWSPRYRVMLGPEAAAELGMRNPMYVGGVQPGQVVRTPDDLELDVEMYSMTHATREEREAKAARLMEALSVLASMPVWVDQRAAARLVGQLYDTPELAQMLNPEIQAALMAQGMTAATPALPAPRLQIPMGPGSSRQPGRIRTGTGGVGSGPADALRSFLHGAGRAA